MKCASLHHTRVGANRSNRSLVGRHRPQSVSEPLAGGRPRLHVAEVKRRRFSLLTLAAPLGLLCACRETPFRTSATYEAPLSQLRLTVEAHGTIKPGRDVSDNATGRAIIESTASGSSGRVRFEFSGGTSVRYHLSSGASRPAPRTTWTVDALRGVLAQGGLQASSDEELEELIVALLGAFGGPKAGIGKGQAEHLIVVDNLSVYE